MQNQSSNIASSSGQDAMKQFQLAELSIGDKSTKDFGLKMSRKIWGYVTTGLGGYYFDRNARFLKNRNFANGRVDVQAMFQDRFEMNGKKNYIRLVWQTLQIMNRVVSGLVGRWMQRGEKIQVTAMDDLSQKDKQKEYENFEFLIFNRKQLEQLQAESGVQLLPEDQEIPADKDELNFWQAQFQRLPEEILYEMGCNEVLSSNGWYDVLKELGLHDCAETGLIGTYTYMDEEGVIHTPRVKPEDAIYSASDYPDFRDASWLGEVPSLKISELRRNWGKEFHPENPLALTEEQLFKIAQTAKEYKTVTNLVWNEMFYSVYLRPYDEWNVRCMKFEVKTVDSEPYTITTTKSTGTTYAQKGYPTTASGKRKEKPSDNQKVMDDTYWNIYRGVYLPDNDTLLEWGIKKNMIRPQDPKEIGNAEFSYSFYMYQNWQMRNMAIPEKIEAAVDQMILACLKIQQDIALAIPPGWVIDETALQNIDYGLGDDDNKGVDHAKLLFQTGKLFYRGLDAEGNRVPVPIQEIPNTGFFQHVEAFIRTYQFWYQTLKDELGEDPNLISSALQPRVTTGNVDVAQQAAEYATDYIYNAYAECMKMTSRKISCLLKDSVKYGSKAYRNILKQEDIGDRIFTTDIKMLPTGQQVADFDAIMNQAMNTTPELALFINPFQLRRIAQEDVKMAEDLFRRGQKKMLIHQQQTAEQNQQATIQGQVQSAQASEQGKQQTEQLKGDIDIQKVKIQEDSANKNATLAMVTSLLSKGEAIPPYLQPLVNTVVENIMIPLAAQNEDEKQAIIQKMRQAQQQSPEEEQQEQGVQQEEMQEQPQIQEQQSPVMAA